MTPFKAVTTCIQEAIAGLFLSEGWAEGESILERASAEKKNMKKCFEVQLIVVLLSLSLLQCLRSACEMDLK